MPKKDLDAERVKKLKAMKVGDSVFVKDATSMDSNIQKIRRLAGEAGLSISIFAIANDSVHKCAGVRIFKGARK